MPASQASLRPVDLRYGLYLARIEVHTTISPDGVLHAVRTDNKSYGPNDSSPKLERTEVREGRLTPAQMAELVALFAGWDSLSDHYGNVPDGGSIQLRYGDKTVAGGSETPQQVWAIKERIDESVAPMPIINR